jgi:hypothetical protein
MLTGLETPVLGHTALMTTADSTPCETREGQLKPGSSHATRSYLVPSLISLGVVVAAAFIRGRREGEQRATRGPTQAARPGAA